MSLRSLIESLSHDLSIKVESLAPQASYTTNGIGFAWGAVTFNQWAMGITVTLGVLTFVVNSYCQRQRIKMERARERREQELHDQRMKQAMRPPTDSEQ
jgi:heme exporter protein D